MKDVGGGVRVGDGEGEGGVVIMEGVVEPGWCECGFMDKCVIVKRVIFHAVEEGIFGVFSQILG